jgi:hypothetical protein
MIPPVSGPGTPRGLHDWVRMRLPAHRLGLLTPEEEASVERHLAVCVECQAAYQDLTELALDQHVPAALLARFSLARSRLRGLERTLVRLHLERCLDCRQDLEALGIDPVLVVDPVLERQEPELVRREEAPRPVERQDEWVTAAASGPIAPSQPGLPSAPPPSGVRPTRAPRRREWMRWVFGGGAMMAAAAVITILLIRRRGEDHGPVAGAPGGPWEGPITGAAPPGAYTEPGLPSSLVAALFAAAAAIAVLYLVGLWKTFTKGGRPGWAALVPFYNLVVILELAQRPVWWIAPMLIPVVNLVPLGLVSMALARRFGKGAGFGLGLAFLGFVFYPVLGFGKVSYRPLSGQPSGR